MITLSQEEQKWLKGFLQRNILESPFYRNEPFVGTPYEFLCRGCGAEYGGRFTKHKDGCMWGIMLKKILTDEEQNG